MESKERVQRLLKVEAAFGASFIDTSHEAMDLKKTDVLFAAWSSVTKLLSVGETTADEATKQFMDEIKETVDKYIKKKTPEGEVDDDDDADG